MSFAVRPGAGVANGTRIDAAATIVFDNQPPLDTRTIFNTVDSAAPATAVNLLPAVVGGTQIAVTWGRGQDDAAGSAVAAYTVYVSEDGGPPTVFLQNTTLTAAAFVGRPGHGYTFTVVATDNVGNAQPAAPAAATRLANAVGSVAGVGVAATAFVPFSGPVARFTAANPAGQAAEFTATIDWGDGTTSPGTVAPDGAGGFVVSGGHTYATGGAFPLAVRIADGAGAATTVAAAAAVPVVTPAVAKQYAVGAGPGTEPVVRTFAADGTPLRTVTAFAPTFAGGVRPVVADFNGDGTPDVAVGTGPGTTAEVKVLDGKTGAVLFDVVPFADFTGGVFVAAGDVDRDGKAELVVTPDEGGGPRVTIYRGGDFAVVANFFGIEDPNFRGGARAALGDMTGDGYADLAVSAGFGGGPRIAVYDGRALADGGRAVHLVNDFFLFEDTLRNGAYLTVGDVDGDGYADLVGGGGPGGGPRVYALSGKDLLAGRDRVLANFFAGDVDNRGGVRVAVKDLDGDARADLVAGDGDGAGSRVTAYLGKDLAGGGAPAWFEADAFPGLTTGVYVG